MSGLYIPIYLHSEASAGTSVRPWALELRAMDAVIPAPAAHAGPSVIIYGDVPLAGLTTPTQHGWANPHAEMLIQLVKSGGEAGAEMVVLRCQDLYSGGPTAAQTYQEGMNRLMMALRDLVPTVSRLGVQVGIQARHGEFLLSPPEMRELLDQTLCPWFGAVLGVDRQTSPELIIDWARTLGRRLWAVVLNRDGGWDTTSVQARRGGLMELLGEHCPTVRLLIPVALW